MTSALHRRHGEHCSNRTLVWGNWGAWAAWKERFKKDSQSRAPNTRRKRNEVMSALVVVSVFPRQISNFKCLSHLFIFPHKASAIALCPVENPRVELGHSMHSSRPGQSSGLTEMRIITIRWNMEMKTLFAYTWLFLFGFGWKVLIHCK